MSPRTTATLAVIAVLLMAFVYIYEIEGGRERKAIAEEANLIHPDIDAEGVTAIELTTLDEVEARFERVEGEWMLVLPVRSRADATTLDAMVHALVDMPKEGIVAARSASASGALAAGADAAGASPSAGGRDLAAFGLGSTAKVIRFEAGGATRGLRIGRTTPKGGHRYVARLADDAVAYVESYRVNAFNRNLDALRDRQIFPFSAGALRTLRMAWPGAGVGEGLTTEIALARDGQEAWQIGSPFVDVADVTTLRELTGNLAHLQAEGFVDQRTPEVESALAQTALFFAWTLEGEHLEHHARIAGRFDGQQLLETSAGRLFRIAPERLDEFPRALSRFRFRTLSSFDGTLAERVEIEYRGGDQSGGPGALRVRAERDGEAWSPDREGLDGDRFAALVEAASQLRAEDIVADEMGAAELGSLGFAPPRVSLRIRGAGASAESTLTSLDFGRVDGARGVFVKRTDRSTVFLASDEIAQWLPLSAAAFERDFRRAEAAENPATEEEAVMPEAPSPAR